MQPLRVVAIGHTGRGDYGHAIDELWTDAADTKLIAVADPSPEGLEAASRRLGVKGYADWRTMLTEVEPEIVVICTRHLENHATMAIAAAEAGVKGIFMEKPFVRTPQEADAVVAACEKSGTKLSVAFVNRHADTFARVREMLDEGRIGRLLEMRARGKEDARGGGEDLWVLGGHLLDLMANLGGPPQWCQATASLAGRPVTKADATEGPEGLGLIAGDRIDAMWGLADGITGFFASVREAGRGQPAFGLTLVGTAGAIQIRPDQQPQAFLRRAPLWRVDRDIPWQPILPDGRLLENAAAAPRASREDRVAVRAGWGRRAAADLVDAIREGREPETGMYASRTVVEMTAAVYASSLSGERIDWPLAKRGNPLG